MTRSFDAADIVVLPVLDVSAAITLGEALTTAAETASKSKKLSKAVTKSLLVLGNRHQVLREGAAERLRAGQGVDGTRTVMTDRRSDGAWGALFSWLGGWSKLPDSVPQSGKARTITGELFPEGLKFLTLPYKEQWAESDTRLLRIAGQKHDAEIESLGGKVFLDELRAAHAEYGEALGITKPPEKPAAETNLRDALTAFRNALRAYVVRVSAQVEEDDAESIALASALLEPLVNWQSPSKNDAGKAALTIEGEAGKVEG